AAALDRCLGRTRIAQRSVERRAARERERLHLRGHVAADVTVESHGSRPRLDIPADLTAERHGVPSQDGITADLALPADRDLVPRTEDVPADLAIDEHRRSCRAPTSANVAAAPDELGSRAQTAAHAS